MLLLVECLLYAPAYEEFTVNSVYIVSIYMYSTGH